MWIDNVDFPEELIAAARSSRLVLFVGAGASIDAPGKRIQVLAARMRTHHGHMAPELAATELEKLERALVDFGTAA